MNETVSQAQVASAVGGIVWSQARRLMDELGIEVVSTGPRTWRIARADFERLRDAMDEVRRPRMAVAS